MSVVTTQPEMLTVPSTSRSWVLAQEPQDSAGARMCVDGGLRVERRRNGTCGDSPTEILMRLPALVLLERIPVPTLAMARDGSILFANTAFTDMVGYQQDGLAGRASSEVFHTVPAVIGALSGVGALANLVVELQHREGWTVRARMSKPLMRREDPVVLVTFDDLTERLWMNEQ